MMNTTLRAGTILVALLLLLSCGSTKTPTRPSTVSLIGTVTAQDGAKLSGAIVRIGDGLNAGRFTTTNDEGKYRFDELAVSSGNVSAIADGYDSVSTGVYMNGPSVLNFSLHTTVPWSKAGTGSAIFDIPPYITNIRVIGIYVGAVSSFVVRVGNCLVVEDQLGTAARRTRSEGTYPVTPALTPSSNIVEISVESSDVSWSLTEDRSTKGGLCYGY